MRTIVDIMNEVAASKPFRKHVDLSKVRHLMEPKEFSFDFNEYEKNMHSVLSDKREYHTMKFDWDEEIESINLVRSSKDEVVIEIHRTTGKGYSSHYREAEYEYIMQSYGTYKCKTMLADRDREAQLIRRFYAGFYDMTVGMKRPERLLFIIKQQLD